MTSLLLEASSSENSPKRSRDRLDGFSSTSPDLERLRGRVGVRDGPAKLSSSVGTLARRGLGSAVGLFTGTSFVASALEASILLESPLFLTLGRTLDGVTIEGIGLLN